MTGAGTVGDPYLIYNKTDLQAMNDDKTAYYELANDIDASGGNFTPIGDLSNRFEGFFDGKGFTISDLTISGTVNGTALFGVVDNTDTYIKNVTLANVAISSVTNNCSALAGLLYKFTLIDNCHSSGTVTQTGGQQAGGLLSNMTFPGVNISRTISNCSSSCTVVGPYIAGGFAANFYNNTFQNFTISNCSATGDITTTGGSGVGAGFIGYVHTTLGDIFIEKCYATGNVTNTGGGPYAGGFMGYGYNTDRVTIQNCYATGSVSTSNSYTGSFVAQAGTQGAITIQDCYGTGLVTGSSTASGGFQGHANVTNLANNYYDTTTTGKSDAVGATPVITADMYKQATYTGWDFTNTWTIVEDTSYPTLQWDTPAGNLYTQDLTDSLIISDSLESSLLTSYSQLETDSAVISDAIELTVLYALNLTETASINENIAKSVDKEATDSANISDSRQTSTHKLLDNSVKVDYIISKGVLRKKTHSGFSRRDSQKAFGSKKSKKGFVN